MIDMKALKFRILLLAIIIVAVTMVSILGAAEDGFDEHDHADVNSTADVPDHFIPPEYFMNARPATPLPESEMISFILSEKTLNISAQDEGSGIIVLPLPSLCQDRYMNYKEHPHRFVETNIGPDDGIVLVQMPEAMYERFRAGAQNNTISLPASPFCRFYDNLTDLDAHLAGEEGVFTVLPGEADANTNTTVPPLAVTPERQESILI
ncbi:hypothetical protein J2129_001133 [Methanofollis sp. W23]|uniref:hypothetical protein n=1 Tax=Methanofollis sp. W23 TaxID=2817849 RepID=UPI001AE30544|nr:hypothetical protein [Methanofollis sp. W23]MBP2145679.1 hypothetical protein [Methanofollis sp. W23]